MKRHPHLLIAAALIVATAAPAQQQELTDTRERLESVRGDIRALERTLAERHQRAEGLDAELASLEQEVAAAARAVRRSEEAIAEQRERLEALRARERAERKRLTEQRAFLAEQIRASWQAGETPFLRLLLSQEQPDRIDRLAVYYRYFNEARAARIETATAALESLAALRDEIEASLTELQELRKQRGERRALLADRLDEREAVLAKVRARIEDDDARLARLRNDESRLGELVTELRTRLERLRERRAQREAATAEPGRITRGEGNWPVAGKVIADYGSPRLGDLRWSGVLIGADTGTPVHAVGAGEVVFSDWLRGVGLLLIIDHGNGRLSLYGHNQTLYREAGERVRAGEVIAAVGASGGQRRSALYFEVRVDGEPVDPLAWLKQRDTRG
ncbi:murein hydrolase activator EnvC family protein [Arhodomonas sp. AD133]|uniref:murein hydrolase activator EnvC family protein n=1 Tax=Arhodomonas sp. AD133 TaxID=3415009 RepID=UPI003EBDCC21